MRKYRRKPTVVEAVQYNGPEKVEFGGEKPLVPGLVWIRLGDDFQTWWPHTVTSSGRYARVWPGDWVVRDPAGSGHYAVEHGTFPALYEAV